MSMKHWIIGIVLVVIALVVWAAVDGTRDFDRAYEHEQQRISDTANCMLRQTQRTASECYDHYYPEEKW